MPKNTETRPPYETFGIPREQVEKDYPEFLKNGWFGSADVEGRLIRETLEGVGFNLNPHSDWEKIGYEVRLIELSMTGLSPEVAGHAKLARDCRKLANVFREASKSLSDLTHSKGISTAAMFMRTPLAAHVSDGLRTAQSLSKLAIYLESIKQPAKWASSERRKLRLVLACKLAPLFEEEFGLPAKPRGGSEAYTEIKDENDWTKFFQGIASLLIDESATPSRQEILWIAARQSEIPSD